MKSENNPGIRLIDANALLRQDDPTYDEEGFRVWYATDINRAPTITPTFQLKDITDEDVARFAMIWQRATSKGVILEPERPQAANNAELFKQTFGIYATELWTMTNAKFTEWLDAEVRMHGGAL